MRKNLNYSIRAAAEGKREKEENTFFGAGARYTFPPSFPMWKLGGWGEGKLINRKRGRIYFLLQNSGEIEARSFSRLKGN